MAASSVTGKGLGNSKKLTTKELANYANGPQIIFTGIIACDSAATSPPSFSGTVKLPYSLKGDETNYVVMLTTIAGGYAYVVNKTVDSNGDFDAFSIIVETDCDVMYMVAKVGSRKK